MKVAEEQLTEVWHAVSSEIYAKVREKTSTGGPQPSQPSQPSQPAQEPGAEAKTGKKEGDVVDADFEMVDEDKKK